MKFLNQYFSENLELRCINNDDASFFYATRSNTDICTMLGWQPYQDIDMAKAYIKRILEDDKVWSYAIVLKKENKTIGAICFFNFTSDNCEMGYEFLPDYQGLGYAFEACECLLSTFVLTLGVSEVLALPNQKNVRSIYLCDRLGFCRWKLENDHIIYRLMLNESGYQV